MLTLIKQTQAYNLMLREKRKGFHHAYLIVMDDSRHLRFVLKAFAKLFFDVENEETKEECDLSARIDADGYPDCLAFPEEGKKPMVEDAEKIQEESALRPMHGDKKVFLVSDFADANASTQNKLLKLLEEPPEGVVFLLGATTSFSVLPTVLSRTKKLEIPSFDVPDVVACLKRTYEGKYDDRVLELSAVASGGNVGNARNVLESGKYNALTETAFDFCLSSINTLPLAVKKHGDTANKKDVFTLLHTIFRDALLLKSGAGTEKDVVLKTELERVKRVMNAYTVGALSKAQSLLSKAEKDVFFNVPFAQAMEICIANLHAYNKNTRS